MKGFDDRKEACIGWLETKTLTTLHRFVQSDIYSFFCTEVS